MPMNNTPTKYVDINEDLSWVLIKPRLTEKAARLGSTDNVYTFNVDQRANKIQIKKAIQQYHKVTPLKVNIIVNNPRPRSFRGKKGTMAGFKKAMVFLKKGDTIDFV